ncbi:hypothetical protein CTEN210_13574 [Chaetoceros tenuissimus]|uniref:Leucine-rich repeat domain-containing protein n=1 Tax=Chaetoceros tenuissimus TaxID=426638 RepID=A0AAD3D3I6_9STRA|nr:hypothetical protein CTEN210_13574 [Chaetoceros tenuissimus]
MSTIRVKTEEWRSFLPGVRIYKGKKTYFYDGEILRDEETGEFLIYDWKERYSWKVIVVLPGVVVIPYGTFTYCTNVETVIVSDSVKRIEKLAFSNCKYLKFVKLSRNVEFIGRKAFQFCESLLSLFIPSSCREIGTAVVDGCRKLSIFSFPKDAVFSSNDSIIEGTLFIKAFPLPREVTETINRAKELGRISRDVNPSVICPKEVAEWMKSINQGEEHELHRICSSSNPNFDTIYSVVKKHKLAAMNTPNKATITPLQYLAQNPFAEIEEMSFLKRYIRKQMGEDI